MRSFLRAIARFLREADIFLLVLGLISTVIGVFLIYSVSAEVRTNGNEVYVQLGALVIGIALFVMFSYLDIDIIADKSGFLMVFSVLFIFTLYFWGYGMEEVGNNSWLRFWGIGIQPAEVVKVPFTIIVAKMIANFKERKSLNSFVSLLQIFAVFLVLFGLILVVSADLGSALVYLFILIAMLFVGGVKFRWFLLGGAIIAALSPLLWFNYFTENQRNRIMAPLLPNLMDTYSLDKVMWHARQSVQAISSGGFLGKGYGSGRMTQRGLIPAQHTDFIFSAAGEEFGFVGCMFVVILLVAIIIRCIYVGVKSNNSLGMLVCVGLASMFMVQTVENIGMCLALLPVIGITLPFFSYGGSSIVTCFAALGIVSGIKIRPKTARFRTL